MSRVGNKIKEERVKKGITEKQMARKCGVSPAYIMDVENGNKIINNTILKKISEVLGKDIESGMLFEQSEPEPKNETKPTKEIKINQKREVVTPLSQWEDALSQVIKKVPIFDIGMKNLKGDKFFPIMNKKVEGVNPDKLAYIEVPDDSLKGFCIEKGDIMLMYLNQEIVHDSFTLIKEKDQFKIRKVKKIDANKIRLLSNQYDIKNEEKRIKDIKIIARGIRVEKTLKF